MRISDWSSDVCSSDLDFARNALIPDELWQSSFVRYATSADKVRAFAKRAGVHESIVAGRIHRERDDYSIFSGLVGRNKLRGTMGCDANVLGGRSEEHTSKS